MKYKTELAVIDFSLGVFSAIILVMVLLLLSGCGGVSEPKQNWEIDIELCEAQDGYTTQEYLGGEIVTYCFIEKDRVCYAICKPNAQYCPEVDCE